MSILRGCQSIFLKTDIFLYVKIDSILADSVNHDRMSPYVAFHIIQLLTQNICISGIISSAKILKIL